MGKGHKGWGWAGKLGQKGVIVNDSERRALGTLAMWEPETVGWSGRWFKVGGVVSLPSSEGDLIPATAKS